jgi:AcrR family transcriptional regulator
LKNRVRIVPYWTVSSARKEHNGPRASSSGVALPPEATEATGTPEAVETPEAAEAPVAGVAPGVAPAPVAGAAPVTEVTPATDHRKGPRRRGAALERAILAAALEELNEVGYAELTMDRVAARARTGKAALYRRWANRAELIVDACKQHVITTTEVPDTGDIRSDMIAFLRLMSARMDSPFGSMMRGLLGEMLRAPELENALRERASGVGPTVVLSILERAVARGEVAPDVLRSRRATVATDLLRHEFLLHGAPIPEETIIDIVDNIYLPLVRA